MGEDQVMVNGYSEQWLRQQFDWVYDKEVLGVGRNVQRGDVVEIVSQQKQSLGVGYMQEKNPSKMLRLEDFIQPYAT